MRRIVVMFIIYCLTSSSAEASINKVPQWNNAPSVVVLTRVITIRGLLKITYWPCRYKFSNGQEQLFQYECLTRERVFTIGLESQLKDFGEKLKRITGSMIQLSTTNLPCLPTQGCVSQLESNEGTYSKVYIRVYAESPLN